MAHRKTKVPLIFIFIGVSILAAASTPKFLDALNRSRQKRTMADMRTIATALEARAMDLNAYFPPLRGHAPASVPSRWMTFACAKSAA